ncbi:glycosyltransferase family 2 protein [bacterium]|nr:glycosyltransferase family 2 protein [bacterium]
MKTMVVIPNWNGEDLLTECLDSLLAQTIKTTIVVVDNGSIDGSVILIEQKYPSVHLIKLPNNTGFAGGVNTGIRYALKNGADAVALFNNDAVADNNWLKTLIDTLNEDPTIGIATCKLLHTDKTHFDSAGDYYNVWGLPLPRGRGKKDTGQYNKRELVFSASGGASLYRSKMLHQIGVFDERFFAYYEDVDMGFRAQLAGWLVCYNPQSVAYHQISATSSKLGLFARYHATKNFYILYLKNMPGRLFWKYLPHFLVRAARMFASSIIRFRFWTQLKAMIKVLILLPSILIDRHNIQKKRVASIAYIDSLLVKKEVL